MDTLSGLTNRVASKPYKTSSFSFHSCSLLSWPNIPEVRFRESRFGSSVMQQLNCVSLLLLVGTLLAALVPLADAARRDELPMATNGEKGAGQAMAVQAIGVGGIRTKPETAVEDAEEEVIRRREGESVNFHFRTRKLPSDVKTQFYGRVPFTADYHSVHRHPPSHN